jgi:hypothetical protein
MTILESGQRTIQFRIISVSKRESSEVNTVRYTYKEGEETQSAKTLGGVWEEIEFAIVYEEKPLIQIANVAGDGYLVGSPAKLLINNPDLFGKYKVGDIIDFIPKTIEEKIVPQSN